MTKPTPNMSSHSVRLPEGLWERLQQYCRRTKGVNASAHLRLVVEAVVDNRITIHKTPKTGVKNNA